jgi:two-component system, OmpR family, KDP operon response regulator KdpE
MNEPAPSILVIEDEPPLQKFLKAALESQNYRVIESTTGKDGLMQAASHTPDLIILDLGLPDIDGLQVARQLREWSKIPIIIVSARGKEQDKVVALDAGADDYLTKPFGVGELLARVRVALRHAASSNQDPGDPTFTTGDLKVDLLKRQVFLADKQIHLTPNEYKLLTALVKNAGMVMTHRQLLKEVWGPFITQESHYIRVYMNQLRQKIEPDPSRPKYLLTEPGVGYRLAANS